MIINLLVYKYLTLEFKTPEDGIFSYVTNTIKYTDENNKSVTSSQRALSLYKNFGIKLLEPIYDAQCFSNVMFIPVNSLLESLKVQEITDKKAKSSVKKFIKTIKCWNFDEVALKYYSHVNVYQMFYEQWTEEKYEVGENDFEDFEKLVYKNEHMKEVNSLKKIQEYNDSIDEDNEQMTGKKKIAIPRFLVAGDELTTRYGNFGEEERMGHFVMTECLKFDGPGWKECLPLPQDVIDDACDQISIMVHTLKIAHNDIKWSNLIYTKGRVHFIDFGLSKDLTNQKDDELERIEHFYQENLREMLGQKWINRDPRQYFFVS